MITGHDYWRRTLAKAIDPETVVVVGYVRGGEERQWTGRISSIENPAGLLVEVDGELRRLCPWDHLRSVESGGVQVDAIADRLAAEAAAAEDEVGW